MASLASVPLAALAVRPVEQPDLLGNYAKLVQLKSLMQQQQYQQQMQPLQLQQAQGALQLQGLQTQEAQRTLERNQAMDQAFGGGAYTIAPDGTATINRKVLYDHLNNSNAGSLIPQLETQLSKLDETHATTAKANADAAEAQAKTQESVTDYMGSIGATINAAKGDPVVTAAALGQAASLGGPYQQHAQAILDHIKQNPQDIPQIANELIAASPKQTAAEKERAETATAQAELPGKQAAAAEAVAKNQALQSYLAANPGKTAADFEVAQKGRQASAEAWGRVGAEKNVEQFKFNLQQGLMPDELKTVAPKFQEPAANQYIKASTDYLGSKQAADDMQTIIDLARSGNKLAYAYSPTTGVLTINSAHGVKRVNMAEIGSYGTAGSAFDRVQGWFGKQITGASIDASVLNDMEQAHDALQKNSTTKYGNQVGTINDTYGSKFKTQQPQSSQDRSLIGAPQPGETVKYNSAGHGIVYRGNKWVDPATGQEVK